MAVAGGPNIVEDGLVFAVDFANKKSHTSGSTAAKDLVGTNDGTVTNGPVYDNGALDFDGNDDYVDFGSIDSSNPMSFYGVTDMAIETWIFQEDSGDPYQRVIDKSNNSNMVNGWGIVLGVSPVSSKRLSFFIDGGDTITTLSGYNFSTWHHITFTKAGSAWKIYIDGALVTSGVSSRAFPETTANMRIGSWNHTTGREWNGKIGTVRAYHRTLTAQEVEQNYNATKGRFGL
jgi:hypothetical protein